MCVLVVLLFNILLSPSWAFSSASSRIFAWTTSGTVKKSEWAAFPLQLTPLRAARLQFCKSEGEEAGLGDGDSLSGCSQPTVHIYVTLKPYSGDSDLYAARCIDDEEEGGPGEIVPHDYVAYSYRPGADKITFDTFDSELVRVDEVCIYVFGKSEEPSRFRLTLQARQEPSYRGEGVRIAASRVESNRLVTQRKKKKKKKKTSQREGGKVGAAELLKLVGSVLWTILSWIFKVNQLWAILFIFAADY
jgi:hypothetical protein